MPLLKLDFGAREKKLRDSIFLKKQKKNKHTHKHTHTHKTKTNKQTNKTNLKKKFLYTRKDKFFNIA